MMYVGPEKYYYKMPVKIFGITIYTKRIKVEAFNNNIKERLQEVIEAFGIIAKK